MLRIEPLAPTDTEEVIPETSSDPEPDISLGEEPQDELPSTVVISETQTKQTKGQINGPMDNSRNWGSRRRGAAVAQLSPPLTTTSSRNASKNAIVDEAGRVQVAAGNIGNGVSQGAEAIHNPASRKGLATKRKPKRPLVSFLLDPTTRLPDTCQQLFESAASSLPPTQIIGESQSLSQGTKLQRNCQGNGLTDDTMFNNEGPRSPSPDPFKLLDGISLSPDATSATRSSPQTTLPRLQPQLENNRLQKRLGAPEAEVRGLLRLGPSSSIAGGPPGLRQWELQASPATNVLGITISDGEDAEENKETASEAEQETPAHPLTGQDGDRAITFNFSPHTLARRTSLFYGLESSSDGEE